MAQQAVQVKSQDPEFIVYLFSPEVGHDCYFTVGNKSLMEPERIGVVKKMLLAHSVVFRTELQESKLREKGDVPLEDLYPDTFKHLLRYVYGHDNTPTLTFDEADNLLYAAEKYMMAVFKNKLATRLMDLLSVDNICSLLNNPACFRVLELNNAITKILQYETDKVLASPLFLNLSPDAFVKILEQGTMNVAEIDVWRAALKWAKEKTGSNDGQILRKQLASPLEKIRICTLDLKDFCSEVVTTKVLSPEEVNFICLYHGNKEKHNGLVDICNDFEPRVHPKISVHELVFNEHTRDKTAPQFTTSLIVSTKTCDLELLPLECVRKSQRSSSSLTYQCDGTVEISEINVGIFNTGKPTITRFCKEVEYDKAVKLPIVTNGKNVRLLANKKYRLRISFTEPHMVYDQESRDPIVYDNEHIAVRVDEINKKGYYYSHVRLLQYEVVG